MPLAYCLDKLLNNQQVLPYFIHFLDACGNIELVQFLMHLQSFKTSIEEGNSKDQLLKDATSIFSLFFHENGPKWIDFPPEIEASIEGKLGVPSSEIFKEAEAFVRSTLDSREFPAFKEHILYKKHEAEMLQNEPSLSDLIHIEVVLQELLELLTSAEERAELQFILASDAFEDEFSKSNGEQALDDAMGIYDRYISMQATTSLSVSSAERLAIESAICQPSGTPERQAFRHLRDRLCEKLEQTYLSPLKTSRTFVNYLEELVSLSECVTHRSSVTEAPRSRLSSINGNEELVPMVEKESILPGSSPSNSKKSSLAQVDSLGRYRSLIDDRRWNPEPSSKNNKLKYKFTSYLNKKAAKEEEEATEAALAIIQDVHRMVSQRSLDS